MMDNNHSNEIIGYRVMRPCSEEFLAYDPDVGVYLTRVEDEVDHVTRGNALRRLASFLDDHPDVDHEEFTVKPVYRELTPMEVAARDLAGLLERLCVARDLDLGLTREQMEAAIAAELRMFRRLGQEAVHQAPSRE